MYLNLSKNRFFIDILKFRKILKLQNKHKKEFFDEEGCGLEIEFGVNYSPNSTAYIATGLKKLKACVGARGKFVTDNTVGCDMNLEIVLNPMRREELKEVFSTIKEIIGYYENFVFNDRCGVHANFRADNEMKKRFYGYLVNGGYKSEMFTHNKYKTDFLQIARRSDGTSLTFEEFLAHQNSISAKYIGVNFLKPNLIEFRALDLDWDKIEYVMDMYDAVAGAGQG